MTIHENIEQMRIKVLYEIKSNSVRQNENGIDLVINRQDMVFTNEEIAEFIAQFANGISVILTFLSSLVEFSEVIGIDQKNYEFQELNFVRYESFEQIDNLEHFKNYYLFWRYLRDLPAPGILIELWLNPHDMLRIAICYTKLLSHQDDLNGFLLELIEQIIVPD